MQADLVLRGGRIFLGKELPEVEALAVAEGRVAEVGNVNGWVSESTRVIDLRGRLVVPGFNDAHVHLLDGGFSLLSVDLRGAKDEAEFVGRIAAYARGLPPGTFILNGNWDHETWGGVLPSRFALDPSTPDHPVFVSRLDGHMALANTAALRLAGVTRNTEDPPGGAIARDAEGEPTGILKDRAMELVTRVIPPPTPELTIRATKAALGEAARLGVTTIQDNSQPEALRAYLTLRDKGELSARLSVWRYADTFHSFEDGEARSGVGDDWVRLGPLKILADGSMGAATAALFEAYDDDPVTSGLLLYSEEALLALVRKADRSGFQLAVHAIGDRANDLVLRAFEAIAKEDPRRERRLRIEHAQIVRESDIERFRAHSVIASIQPCHLIDDMRFALRRIGETRCRSLYRVRSFLSASVPVAFGTDWPVEPLDPRLGLYAAVTREFVQGGPQGGFTPEERISLREAIDLYTRGSAYAEFAEGRKGTLAPGNLADLVVFREDLLSLPPSALLTTPVDLTVVGGRVVYEA